MYCASVKRCKFSKVFFLPFLSLNKPILMNNDTEQAKILKNDKGYKIVCDDCTYPVSISYINKLINRGEKKIFCDELNSTQAKSQTKASSL